MERVWAGIPRPTIRKLCRNSMDLAKWCGGWGVAPRGNRKHCRDVEIGGVSRDPTDPRSLCISQAIPVVRETAWPKSAATFDISQIRYPRSIPLASISTFAFRVFRRHRFLLEKSFVSFVFPAFLFPLSFFYFYFDMVASVGGNDLWCPVDSSLVIT